MTQTGRSAAHRPTLALLRRMALILALTLGAAGPSVLAQTVLAQTVLAQTVADPDATVQVDPSGSISRPKPAQIPPVAAGDGRASLTGPKASISIGGKTGPGAVDYAGWERMASRAESAILDRNAANQTLENLRVQLVDWREALLGAQNANSARIATLRTQIAALGPAPEPGAPEVEEIAKRRGQLSDQLVRLQAPGIAAEEAYLRADGLIGEIDRSVRERQTNALLKHWPTPINPANWPEALVALSDTAVAIWSETARRWADPRARLALVDNLPLILVLLAFAWAVLWRGRYWTNRVGARLQGSASAHQQAIWGFVTSLGLIAVPVLGVVALSSALRLSGMLGGIGLVLVDNLVRIGFTLFAAIWLGGRVFPALAPAEGALAVTDDARASGRFLATAFGLVLALRRLLRVTLDQMDLSEAAISVLNLPIIVIAGLLVLRMGQQMRGQIGLEAAGEDGRGYRNRMIAILARAAIGIGVIGPLLAAVGYISAAASLVFPAAISLGLVGLLFVLQRLVADVYAVATRGARSDQDALVPVLIGFALIVASLPLFALIWGARTADMTELWTRFREGFQMGETRISPTDFLFFAVIFAIGLTLTRLLQGAMKATILPRTGMDQGGQNAIVSGLGYVGIFLAGLVAINSTGIDLSGLAIVAGALSVGIGFGLQTVVSNFVSGIILLIERPVSEGDWIEVGGVQGTVKSISVRSTRIQTFDRSDVIVPNSDLISGRVTNWTRYNLSGRLTVPVGVTYGSDSRKVERLLREIAEAQPLAVLNPPPVIGFMGFGAESMNFEIRVILRDINFALNVRSEINHQIASRFAAEGIELPHTMSAATVRKREADLLVPPDPVPPPAFQHATARPRKPRADD